MGTWSSTVTETTFLAGIQLLASPTGTTWPSRWTVQQSSNCGGKPSASQEVLTPGTSTTRCGVCRLIKRATTCCWEDLETSTHTAQPLEAGPVTSGSPTSLWSARTGTSCTRASTATRLEMRPGST